MKSLGVASLFTFVSSLANSANVVITEVHFGKGDQNNIGLFNEKITVMINFKF